MQTRLASGLVSIYICVTALSASFGQVSPPVAVAGGKVQGRTLDGRAVFKGIPYAAPPEGDLRWKPPMPVKPWPGVRDAFEYAPPCAQVDAGWNKVSAATGREDCLYLNVWTPEFPSKSKKPVMLWIHGGGNMGGSALGLGGIEPAFNGASLAAHGVVVVTISYRLGLLGFMAHPALSSESPHHVSGNYGLLDIIAALHWVQANIANFGGDPANVTVFGQSAGARDIGVMLVMPASKGLFVRAIEESGTVAGIGSRATQTLADAEKRGAQWATSMGAPAAGTLAYMRKLTAADVLKASPPYGQGELGAATDGYLIPADPARLFATGKERRLPLLLGSNAREQMLNGGSEALHKAIVGFYDDDKFAARAIAGFSKPSDYPPYGDAGAQFATDNYNRCPTVTTA